LHVTASCTSLSRTQLSPDRARISYSFSWICDTLRQIWEMRDERVDLRDKRWDAESMEKKADLRDRDERQIWEMRGRERWRLRKWEWWDKFRVRKYVIYTPFCFSRDSLVEPGRFGSIRFGSICFRLWKPKPNRTGNIL